MKNGSGIEASRVSLTWGKAPSTGPSRAYASVLKRATDLFIAIPMLILLSPLMALVAIVIKLSDGGPALFIHQRCGVNGEMFRCLKFRTMRVDAKARLDKLLESDPAAASEWAQYQKLRNDPRVTFFGKFLRKSSLDELPQLLNIIRGHMSIIGPRPITSGEIHRYGPNFHYYSSVRPGVLGLWQVNGRNNLTYDQRVAMDIEYARDWTYMTDVKIFLKAIPTVLFGGGAY